MYNPKVTVEVIHRHKWSARDQIDIGFEYEDYWEDEQGTIFKVTPLARTRDTYDYLISAYPYGVKAPYHKILYWKRRIDQYNRALMTLPNFIHAIQADVDNFLHVYYNHEREGTIPLTSHGEQPHGGYIIEETEEPYWYE